MKTGATSTLVLALAAMAALGSLLVMASPASAQDSPISAEVDYSRVSVDEIFALTVTVTGSANAPEPSLPAMDWAVVVSQSLARQIANFNNTIVSKEINHYRLQPTRIGVHTIGPISVDIGGQTYETEPIEVEVTRAGTGRVPARPAPTPFVIPGLSPADEQDAFLVSAAVDNPSPYLGQQVTYSFRYLSVYGFSRWPRGYQPPDFTGFWHEDPFQREIEDIVGTRRYRGMAINTPIFPAVEGTVTIEPSSITVPPSSFRRGRTLETDPVQLEVRPLPEGEPDDFRGAVGDYNVAARITSGAATANEPLTLTMIIAGRGNLETLPDPILPELSGWRSFDGESSVRTQITDDELMGARTIERIYVPSSPGAFTIPGIPFSYFDPFAEEYRTVFTEPISLTVAPSPGGEAPTLASNRDEVERLGSDIRHIKPAPSELRPSDSAITGSAAYRLGWAAPLAAIALAAGLKLHRGRRRDPVELRRRSAYENAMKAVDLAGAADNPADNAGAALSAYLGDVLGQGAAGMTQDALAEALAGRGAGEALVGRVLDALSLSEGARFAPGVDAESDSLVDEVRRLVTELEQEINS